MKIIWRDNYNRDEKSEYFIAKGMTTYNAERIAKLLNQVEGGLTENYFVAVHDNYQLYKYEED